jgi:cation diffusion facilitator CzcD-associated flavoprotein CzcO
MTTNDLCAGAQRWLNDFGTALATHDHERLMMLFAEESYLRDNGALTFDYRQFHGRDAVIDILLRIADEIKPANMRLSASWPAPDLVGEPGAQVVEVYFDFDTASGIGLGMLHGHIDATSPYGFAGRALYTRLEGLAGVDLPPVHPRGYGFVPQEPGQNWKQNRDRSRAFVDSDPEVLIVGAGQAGLISAAHLKRLGVNALVIDRHERVGDNWRKRYHSLNLHNPIEMNRFPFLPFPEHYPEYLPKDVIADWLEIYARYFDLNIWSSTSFDGAVRDEEHDRWSARVTLADGPQRVLHPQHIILATGGIGGKPNIPALPGLSDFWGSVIHSSGFSGGEQYADQKVIVVGVGSSGHDIALDLYKNGCEVTMVQRSPVIVNHVSTANLAYASYFDGTPNRLVDLRYGVGLISPLRVAASKKYHQFAKEQDAELLDGLKAAGMVLGDGHKGAGWLDLFLRTGGGYYLNVGASEVIVEGGISVIQNDEIDQFIANGALLKDGGVLEADLVVLATGYQNRSVEVAEWFGPEVANRVGEIARLDDEGEWKNVWRQTAQRGLWFNGGGINQVRPGSRVLALLVKASLNGLIPPSLEVAATSSPAIK